MIIRRIEYNDINQSKALWKSAFPEDSSSFIDWFFLNQFKPEFSPGVFENGQLISAAYGIYRPLMSSGKSIPALMISGVSTYPDYRCRGAMHMCLNHLRDIAAASSIFVLYNHPAVPGTYYSLGYRDCTSSLYFSEDKSYFMGTRTNLTCAPFSSEDAFPIYKQAMEKYNCFSFRDRKSFSLRREECYLDGGEGVLFERNGSPIGYAFFDYSDNTLCCQEILMTNDDYIGALSCIFHHFHPSRIKAKLPPNATAPGKIRPQNVLSAPPEYSSLFSGSLPSFCIDEY